VLLSRDRRRGSGAGARCWPPSASTRFEARRARGPPSPAAAALEPAFRVAELLIRCEARGEAGRGVDISSDGQLFWLIARSLEARGAWIWPAFRRADRGRAVIGHLPAPVRRESFGSSPLALAGLV